MSELLLRELAVLGQSCPIITADHPDYERYRKVWNGVADRHPAAIVRPCSADEVLLAVRAAATAGVLVAIRGGGHSLPGFSTCDGGLVIDLAELNEISLDREAGIVEVGGGALLGDLDRALAPEGLVVPAGVISHTGVAGLTLGGGMGWLSRRFGLTIDSLLEAEIVTAAGEIVRTSATSDPELYWGIRGGGGNFGVVTRFRFRVHPLGQITVGKWTYPAASAGAALRMLRERAHGQKRELALNFTVTRAGMQVTAVWSGDTALADLMLVPFGALAEGGAGSIEPTSYLSLQSRNDAFFAWSRRYYCKGGFWSDISDAAIEAIVQASRDAPTDDAEIYVLLLGGAVADVSDEATAYTGRAAGYYWLAEPVWDEVADDERCIGWGRATGKLLAGFSMAGNYVNEQADAGIAVALDAYGAEKYQRLGRLKARLDPHNLFRLNQNITPLA